jgi:hypothetical protein
MAGLTFQLGVFSLQNKTQLAVVKFIFVQHRQRRVQTAMLFMALGAGLVAVECVIAPLLLQFQGHLAVTGQTFFCSNFGTDVVALRAIIRAFQFRMGLTQRSWREPLRG